MHFCKKSPYPCPVLFLLIFGVALLNFPGALGASEILQEPFTAPDGGLPDGWMVIRAGNPQSAEISSDAGGHGPGLWQCRSPEGAGNSVIYLGSKDEERKFSDCSGSVIMVSTKPWAGIILRAERRTLVKFEGYFIGLNPTSPNGALIISRSPTSHVDMGEILTTTPLPFAVREEWLVLKFTAEGSKLAASLFHWNNGKPNFQSPIASVEINDAIIEGGFFGFRSAFGNSGWVVWKDLNLTIQN